MLMTGIDVTEVGDTERHAIGTVVAVPDGVRGLKYYRYIKLGAAVSAAVGDVIARPSDDAVLTECVLAVSSSHTRQDVVGVAQTAMAAGDYGFVQTSGYATIKTDDGVSASEVLVLHTVAGETDTFATGEENIIVGKAVADDVSDLTSAWLDIPNFL